jgi:hypothetical protein
MLEPDVGRSGRRRRGGRGVRVAAGFSRRRHRDRAGRAGTGVLGGDHGARGADRAGVFDAAAALCARAARGSTCGLFVLIAALGTLTTVTMSLDTTAVLLTPVVLTLAVRLGLRPLPFAMLAVWLAILTTQTALPDPHTVATCDSTTVATAPNHHDRSHDEPCSPTKPLTESFRGGS